MDKIPQKWEAPKPPASYFAHKRLLLACGAFLAAGVITGIAATCLGDIVRGVVHGAASVAVMLLAWKLTRLNDEEDEARRG